MGDRSRSPSAAFRGSASLLLALAGCGPSTGHDPLSDVTFQIEGVPRPDWRPTVSACLDPAWDWRLAAFPSASPAGVIVRVPAEHLDANARSRVVRCLRDRDGVRWVDVPRLQ